MDSRCEEITTALPNKLCSGQYKATEEEGDQRITGEETWSGVRNEDSRIQIQLEEDGGDGSRQNWMQKSGLRSMLH